jgi:hypothetical protein
MNITNTHMYIAHVSKVDVIDSGIYRRCLNLFLNYENNLGIKERKSSR